MWGKYSTKALSEPEYLRFSLLFLRFYDSTDVSLRFSRIW